MTGTAQDLAKAARTPNPGSAAPKSFSVEDYIPMDLPQTKLAVPEIPGYYLYWHLGKNVNRALQHGYTFVENDEVQQMPPDVGNGGTDLGSRISREAGLDEHGREERLYLMKLPMELHLRAMELKTNRSEEIARRIRAGTVGAETDPDRNKRHMKEGQHLFYPKARKP